MMYNPMNSGMDARFDDRPEPMPRRGFHHGREAMGTMPRGFDGLNEAPRCMPRGHDFGPDNFDGRGFGPGGHGGFGGHSGPGGFGPGGHGGFGPGGRPPRHPDPQFLKRRVEEGDLMDLIDMAGRMAQRRPQGGPARSQALVLSILAGREALSQRELQQMLGIQPGSLSELLTKLEGKGYLVREKAEDRRGNLLRITDEGRRAIPTADDLSGDDPFAALTEEQQNQLAALLRALLGSWVDALEADSPRSPIPHRNRPVEL